MKLKEKLESVADYASNLALEDVEEKSGIKPEPCIRLSDAISILEEALRLQREACANAYMTAQDCDYVRIVAGNTISIFKREEILNSPQPEME